ncbi:MAG: DedA family protein [Herminiimonas sp.]|nr:DedA family protein [Herminiimonas sp.]
MIESAVAWLLHLLSAPEVGLGSVFVISLVSATLVPLGSEPAVFAAVKAMPENFWLLIGVATLGNTLGGIIDYWMGLGARNALLASIRPDEPYAAERSSRWFGWLERFGARTMLLAWVPGIGDPICTLAGWLRLPFWPSVAYMAIGKFLRYLTMTWLLMEVPDGFWRQVAGWLS